MSHASEICIRVRPYNTLSYGHLKSRNHEECLLLTFALQSLLEDWLHLQ